jgi:hypothetical protein
MVALQGTSMSSVPLADAIGTLKTVPAQRYQEIAHLFG